MTLVTIDFHNTLFRCDDWFQLEIELLPSAVIDALGPEISEPADVSAIKREGREIYRGIRRQAMDSGVECDADSSILQVFDRLNLSIGESNVRCAVQRVMRATVDAARPRSGAIELVNHLERRGIPIAIVSSAAYHPFLEWCLQRHGIRHAFEQVVTSADCGIYKSNPQIYQHTLDLFGASPGASVHIGDSHRFDVTSASRVGMRTILLTSESSLDLDPQPDAIIQSLGDAAPHLDRLLSS